jgi:G3E family GTPase
LNKCDTVLAADVDFAKTFIAKINPRANIICTSFSQIDPKKILNTGLFTMEDARNSPGWLQDLRSPPSQQLSESEEYGVASWIYTARKPFHPDRLYRWIRRYFVLGEEFDFGGESSTGKRPSPHQIDSLQRVSDQRHDAMESEIGWVARSKGFLWIATRGEQIAVWNHGGRLLEISPSAEWLVDTPESDWGATSPEELERMKQEFSGIYGDKRQEIVFIGIGMKVGAMRMGLDDCLLTDAEFEMKESDWSRYYDPFPPWPIQPGTWSQCVVANTALKLNIPESMELELSHVALEVPCDAASVPVVCQVLLRNKFRDNLLCTLRSTSCDQCHVNLRLHGESSEIFIRLMSPHADAMASGPVLVHLFGFAGVVETGEDGDEDVEESSEEVE